MNSSLSPFQLPGEFGRQRRRTALLVEANPEDAFLMAQALRKSELVDEVAVATEGFKALHRLFGPRQSESNELPSFVVLDMQLPRLGGLAVLRRIRAEKATRQLPVVVLTASQAERDMAECYSNGRNTYLEKPVDPCNVICAVQRLPLAPRGIETPAASRAITANSFTSQP